MKPSPFRYLLPANVDEAVAMLRSDDDAKVIAGGQSLMALMNFRLAAPTALVDIKRVRTLAGHEVGRDELVVRALCRHRDIEMDTEVRDRCAAIADAVKEIGHVAIRNRGTAVGSVCHADPTAEWPALAVLLDATIVAIGGDGVRRIPAHEFFLGPFTTALSAEELVTEVRFPFPAATAGSAYLELARRRGDFAIVGVGATLDASDVVHAGRIVLSGCGPAPIRAREAEEFVVGRALTPATFAEAGRLAAAAVNPHSDVQATADYRRSIASVLVRRALAQAGERIPA